MELRPGYKQTEAGAIPKEWDVKPIHSVLSKGRLGGNYQNRDLESDFPLMKMGNIARGYFDMSKVEFITPGVIPEDQHRLVHGDVLFNTRNTLELVGKVAIWRDELPVAYYNSNLMRLEFDPNEIESNEYANYALNTYGSVTRLRSLATGTTSVAAIYTRDLMEFLMVVPPTKEQRVIAEALSDVDALLGGLDRLIVKKRDLKQAAMQQLLKGQTRLPGFSDDWEAAEFGDIATIRNTKVIPSSLSPVPRCVELESIEQGTGRLLGSIEANGASSKYSFKKGDVLFGRLRAYLRKYCLATFNGICSTEIWPLIPRDERLCAGYIHLLVQTQEFVDAAGVSYGTHMPRSDWSVLSKFSVQVPPILEQTAIATVLSDMDAELAALEARRDKTRALKQCMMQELLTGRIRLVESSTRASEQPAPQTDGQQANIHFKRSVLAAEIIDRLHAEPTFGHVKFEKVMFLIEHLCAVDTGSTYLRKAAGPYDNRALRSIDSQLRKQQWFDCRKEGERYRYMPLEHRGGHKRYFERYFADITDTFENVLQTFKTLETERCEIVATLLSAWGDLLQAEGDVSDERIVHEVLNNWHKSKERIPKDRWLKALEWMRSRGFVPREGA